VAAVIGPGKLDRAVRVIVVGAGMAGLTAADAARCAGVEVVVLEARDRIGGRTWTVPLGPGALDLGGSWVHDPVGNPLAEVLATAGIGARNDGSYYSRMAVWADGWVGAPEVTALSAAVGAWDPSEALVALAGSDRFVEGVEWFIADRELDGRAGELARFGLLWIMGPLVVAGPPDRISLAGTAAYAAGTGGNLVPTGGYRTLVERLSAGLDVRLGTPVTSVEHGGTDVIVRSRSGTFESDRVVVTVPLGVLGDGTLAFEPPLGSAYAGAVERLGMGTLEKIAFRFQERFWPESVWQITHVSDDRSFPVWFDFSRHVGSPTLVGLYNPAVTPGVAELPVEQRVGPALDVLRKMFGSVPDPAEMLTTDWAGDSRARGSYSYVPIGATVEDMKRLAEPVSGKLVLAGEATVPAFYGTVHAAFCSGLQAAGHVLGKRPERLSLGVIPPHWLDAV
jgi:polyamine oxidase